MGTGAWGVSDWGAFPWGGGYQAPHNVPKGGNNFAVLANCLYSDIDMNFVESTNGGVVYDHDAVWQAMTNLFNTGYGNRVFNPQINLDLEYYLGEQLSADVAMKMFSFLTQGIPALEPRFVLQTRSCNIIPDYTSYAYILVLVGSMIGLGSKTFEYQGQLQQG